MVLQIAGFPAAKRYMPFGTVISNRAPFPGSPFSVIVMPVIERISRERKKYGVLSGRSPGSWVR